MIRGLGSDDGEGSCTAVPFAVEMLFEVPFVGKDVALLFEAFKGEVPFAVGIEEPGSFR